MQTCSIHTEPVNSLSISQSDKQNAPIPTHLYATGRRARILRKRAALSASQSSTLSSSNQDWSGHLPAGLRNEMGSPDCCMAGWLVSGKSELVWALVLSGCFWKELSMHVDPAYAAKITKRMHLRDTCSRRMKSVRSAADWVWAQLALFAATSTGRKKLPRVVIPHRGSRLPNGGTRGQVDDSTVCLQSSDLTVC